MADDDPLFPPPLNPAAPNPKVAELIRALAGGVAHGVGNIVSMPKRAMEQGITSEQAVPWAGDTALTMAGVRTPFAAPGTAGVFGGHLAQTADLKKLEKAMDMASDRVKGTLGDVRRLPSQIWDETGWFKGADDRWKFEIPDHKSYVDPYGRSVLDSGQHQPLSQFLHHEPLFEAYPELKNLNIHSDIPKGYDAMFFGDSVGLKRDRPWELNNRSSALHEIQHAIQRKEGFAGGTNPKYEYLNLPTENTGHPIVEQLRKAVATGQYGMPGDPTFTEKARQLLQLEREVNSQRAEDLYRRNAGEVEARNVQGRMLWSPQQLKEAPPFVTEDVPRAKQVIPKPTHPSQWQLMQALRR